MGHVSRLPTARHPQGIHTPCRFRPVHPADHRPPAAEQIVALRKRMKLSRQKFADRFGLDARAIQDWEQGRRVPDRAARVLLTVIDREPDAVMRALTPPAG